MNLDQCNDSELQVESGGSKKEERCAKTDGGDGQDGEVKEEFEVVQQAGAKVEAVDRPVGMVRRSSGGGRYANRWSDVFQREER